MEARLAELFKDGEISSRVTNVLDTRSSDTATASMAGVDLYGGHIKPYGETVFNNKMQGNRGKIRALINEKAAATLPMSEDNISAWVTEVAADVFPDPKSALTFLYRTRASMRLHGTY
ncbi:wsv464 [White spot syndrome virus]|nr:hypothetical protein [White spot syndrome virus]ASA40503.1 wsv464 [White spot syndrome virus]AYW76652.1 hypothetical protein [Procambarus clarkii virus]